MNKTNSFKEWPSQQRLFYRMCGIANGLGGVIFALSYIFLPASIRNSSVVILCSLMTATVLIAIGLLGLYVRHVESISRFGFIGFTIALVGLVGMFSIYLLVMDVESSASLFETLVLGYPGLGNPNEAATYWYALFVICLVIGYLNLGWLMFRASLLPLAAISVMMVGVVVFVLGLSNNTLCVVRPLGAVMFALALLWLGFMLWYEASD
ncbi:hypothetical protein ACFL17_01880 [Pseudomonadota bacterium]